MKTQLHLFNCITRTIGIAIAIFTIAGAELFSGTAAQQSSQQSFNDSTLVDKIAFYSGRYSNREICLMNADGTGFQRLTNNTAHDECPSFSPDGRKIAFSSIRDGNYEIYLMNSDGTDQQRLTHSPENDDHADWSPDGTKIAFSRYTDQSYANIFVMNADGSNVQQITSNSGENMRPDWSPDGTRILFNTNKDGNYEIYLMNADGSNQQRLTNTTAFEIFPQLSPDGNKIIYARLIMNPFSCEIHIRNLDGSGDVALTHNSRSEDPVWSPDGKQIAFQTSRDGNFEVYVMNLDGSNQQRLTNHSSWDGWPSWGTIQIPDTSDHPIEVDSLSIEIRSGWNMISIPVDSTYHKSGLFPSSISAAFFYDHDSSRYVMKDTLESGKSYWLKFPYSETIMLYGDIVYVDSFDVKPGWNMIGSISKPVPVITIISDPPGMITSNVFTYQSGYVISDTIITGNGYWIKVDQTGQLILTASEITCSSQCIRIVNNSGNPPSPPDEGMSVGDNEVPSRFLLYQNYPNPFNPSTTINYQLSIQSYVTLKIFDVLGREVATLVNRVEEAGYKSVEFNASKLSSSVHYYRLQAGNYIETKKLLLLR